MPFDSPFGMYEALGRARNDNFGNMLQGISGLGQGLGQTGVGIADIMNHFKQKKVINDLMSKLHGPQQSQGQPQGGPMGMMGQMSPMGMMGQMGQGMQMPGQGMPNPMDQMMQKNTGMFNGPLGLGGNDPMGLFQ